MNVNTKLWKLSTPIDKENPAIMEAAELLRDKQVVAFPTETVYGLGADAADEEAVQKIFEAKGRPADNPLIVHVSDPSQVFQLVTEIPEIASKLMSAFWPGPLTLVLPSNGRAAKNVTAGLTTVAIRMPNDPVALAVLHASALPLAAPSANLSGRPSPTDAEHVMQDLAGKISAVLDGGPTGVGVESTVVDCTTEIPIILRPGGVTKEDLREIVPDIIVDPALADVHNEKPKSPGMKYTHYAPESPLWLIDGDAGFFKEQLQQLKEEGQRIGVIASSELAAELDHESIIACGTRRDLAGIAGELYRALRHFKKAEVDLILCETFEETGVGAAVMNRLKKAASHKIIQH
ncbi:L-threonylcarbamoyladenylate synthase [Halobacillus massiliensis]|uniref:L-threonylcarbamoyladenylate synthase n=1 Tax=Halobacillus massiliensis TaxID=1926286 RepID=UPI0009E3FEC9|nr:L-threonylcarbamoyladenylate synthase [Halobacillus massiliensis]